MSVDWSQERFGGKSETGSAGPATGQLPDNRNRRIRTPTTVVLLDQNPLWLRAIERILERIDIEVVGKATSPKRALALIAEQKPDLLIAGMQGGDSDVVACLRRAKERVASLRMIVFCSSDDGGDISAAFSAGASAYVRKPTHPPEIRPW